MCVCVCVSVSVSVCVGGGGGGNNYIQVLFWFLVRGGMGAGCCFIGGGCSITF